MASTAVGSGINSVWGTRGCLEQLGAKLPRPTQPELPDNEKAIAESVGSPVHAVFLPNRTVRFIGCLRHVSPRQPDGPIRADADVSCTKNLELGRVLQPQKRIRNRPKRGRSVSLAPNGAEAPQQALADPFSPPRPWHPGPLTIASTLTSDVTLLVTRLELEERRALHRLSQARCPDHDLAVVDDHR